MVTGGRTSDAANPEPTADAGGSADGLDLWIDGGRPLTTATVAAVGAACDRSEESGHRTVVTVHLSGAPADASPGNLTTALVSKWERALRRLERLPTVTIAVAEGDCGGSALDALLATDYRIASTTVRLLMPTVAGATWPGMVLYRLARQAGETAARRAVLLGTPIEAGDALAMHLVDQLADDPVGALAPVAEAAASLSGTELAIRRQLVMEAPAAAFEDALGVHLAACDRALRRAAAEAAW